MTPTPPRWAEALLRLLLTRIDFDTISGDLLEEYRDTVHPIRGRAAADAWYVRQVLGFVSRRAGLWAFLLASAGLARTALDWLAPPADFYLRSAVSTYFMIGILVTAGIWASVRSGSPLAGTVAGVAVTALGAVMSIVGAMGLLAIWHDPITMAAIRASGGLGEVFELPIVLILPGAALGTLGGLIGTGLRRFAIG